ncbi:MAG: hypothetical protein VW405_13090 [Rhodospirillaceae bacterium]
MPGSKKKGLDWESMFRKYIWNDQTTPYFTAVPDLNRRQANSEILFYCLFLAVLFGVVSLTSLRGGLGGGSTGVSYYGFSVVCAAILFGIAKVYAAALYLSATPLVGLAYLFLYGLGAERPTGDTIIVAVILLVLLRYSVRIVAVARAYPDLPSAPAD